MLEQKKKIAKMLDEIFRYFIEKNANNISMEYEDKKDKYEVICKSSLSVTDEEIEYLLSKYVKHQGLEYDMYWELMGEDSDEDELELLFMLADDVRIYYENNILEIIVEIKK